MIKKFKFKTKSIQLHGVKILYPILFESIENKFSTQEYNKRVYACTFLSKKGDYFEEINKKTIRKAIEEFKQMNDITSIERIPFVDGDIKKNTNPFEDDTDNKPNVKSGHWVISCRNKGSEESIENKKPFVFIKDVETGEITKIESKEDFERYVVDGAYCTAYIDLSLYDYQGVGISCSLNKIVLYNKVDFEVKEAALEYRNRDKVTYVNKNELTESEMDSFEKNYKEFSKNELSKVPF